MRSVFETLPIGIERAEKPLTLEHLLDPEHAREGAFLVDENHGVVLAGGIVHGYDEIPVIPGHPEMGAGILVEHHAGHGAALPALSMPSLALGLCDKPSALEAVFNPCVAA